MAEFIAERHTWDADDIALYWDTWGDGLWCRGCGNKAEESGDGESEDC